MTKEEAYEKLDHTLCLNNVKGNIEFSIGDIDCQSVEEMVDCLELIKPKHYLKWEDLEFKEEEQTMKVKMGERKYTLIYHKWFMLNKWYYHAELRNEETLEIIHNIRGGIFNDLHLEGVLE